MQLIATLTHSPDHCWTREENEEMAKEWINGMYDRADELGVDLQAAYVTPSEHAFYFVLEADDFDSVTTSSVHRSRRTTRRTSLRCSRSSGPRRHSWRGERPTGLARSTPSIRVQRRFRPGRSTQD